MAKTRIVPIDDTIETAQKVEQAIRDYFPTARLEKVSSSLWYIHLQEYHWTLADADFLNQVASQKLLAAWAHQEE